jgi:hypothetical protein
MIVSNANYHQDTKAKNIWKHGDVDLEEVYEQLSPREFDFILHHESEKYGLQS